MKNLKDAVVCVYVDDDENILEAMHNILQRRMKDVYTATNGVEGLEIIKLIKPDVIITDINMPIMDGLDMIKNIRNNGIKTRNIPIIAVTAYREDQFFTQLADVYLYKPIDVKALLATIEELINKD
jgi:CheY-like chemotaxis protein